MSKCKLKVNVKILSIVTCNNFCRCINGMREFGKSYWPTFDWVNCGAWVGEEKACFRCNVVCKLFISSINLSMGIILYEVLQIYSIPGDSSIRYYMILNLLTHIDSTVDRWFNLNIFRCAFNSEIKAAELKCCCIACCLISSSTLFAFHLHHFPQLWLTQWFNVFDFSVDPTKLQENETVQSNSAEVCMRWCT